MRVAVVVLNWNTQDYLRAFLPGLQSSCKRLGTCPDGSPVAELIVADSGSTDGSAEVLAKEFPDIRAIPLGRNYGFTGGYLRAFGHLRSSGAEYEYYILLNSDIEVEDGWLEPLLAWMDSHPECGVCGPKLHGLLRGGAGFIRSGRFEYAGAAGGLLDRWGFPYCRGRIRKKVEEDRGQYDGADRNVLWVTGSCLMVRRSVWEKLGGLDDRFFAHQEEIDFCWRAQLAGWRVQVVPESLVWHLGGGTLPPQSPVKLKLNFRNNLLMLGKNLVPTYLSEGMSRKKAERKAKRLIRFRVFLDNCAGIAYFCIAKPEYSRAVRDAHREWKELRKLPCNKQEALESAKVYGLTGKCVFLK